MKAARQTSESTGTENRSAVAEGKAESQGGVGGGLQRSKRKPGGEAPVHHDHGDAFTSVPLS